MSWVKLDDQFFRKHLEAGAAGRALILAAWCYCGTNLTDGMIPKTAVPVLLAEAEAPRKTIDRLAALGQWEDRGDYYFDPEFSETQRTRAEIEGVRDAAQVRMEAARSSERSREQQGEPPGERSGTPVLSCPKKNSPSFEVDFESVWAIYPRKVARADALKAYTARRRAGVSAEQLALAVGHYAEDCRINEREPRFVLHGATFFGPNERWKDYLEPPKPATNGHVSAGDLPW